MGIGYDFGPPREDLKKPSGKTGWFGKRSLSAEQMRELGRAIESWGGTIAEQTDALIAIEGEHEVFVVKPEGGSLNKPNVGGEDEHDRLWNLACSICDWAGWIMVGEGLVFGASMECATCGEEGDPCPNDHDDAQLRMKLEVSAPDALGERPRTTSLDAIRRAGTTAELRAALAGVESVPFNDTACVVALLLSDDDDIVRGALDAIERADGSQLTSRRPLIDARLRRIAMLGDDPALADRASKLRARLPR